MMLISIKVTHTMGAQWSGSACVYLHECASVGRGVICVRVCVCARVGVEVCMFVGVEH